MYILFDECKLKLFPKLDVNVEHSSAFAGEIGAVYLDILRSDANDIGDNGDIGEDDIDDDFLSRELTVLINKEKK